ncbi:MAG: RHS repeat-associated core domain-containing protein, partial [Planctomycetaceae bacterium]
WDDDAGLYHYRARWYDPALGRFLSEDPIGFDSGDANLQRYVGNASTNLTDPSGLDAILTAPDWSKPLRRAPSVEIGPPARRTDIPEPPPEPLSLAPMRRRALEPDPPVVTEPQMKPYRRTDRTPPALHVPSWIKPMEPQKMPNIEPLLGRWLPRNRDWVLWGIPRLQPSDDLPGVRHRNGAAGDTWWKGVLGPEAIAGPTGLGPCVGLILIPPNRELETIVFHFGPNVCIRSGLLRSGVIRIEPINRDTAVTVVEPDYTAVLAGVQVPPATRRPVVGAATDGATKFPEEPVRSFASSKRSRSSPMADRPRSGPHRASSVGTGSGSSAGPITTAGFTNCA